MFKRTYACSPGEYKDKILKQNDNPKEKLG